MGQKNGVVILLDTLGTQGAWLNRRPSEILESFKKVIDLSKDIMKSPESSKLALNMTNSMTNDSNHAEMRDSSIGINKKFYSFSDTMILTFYEMSMVRNLLEAAIVVNIIFIKELFLVSYIGVH
jgi:hypothetical protein